MIAGLPYDAEVEYLESTGTQWIDTRVIPTVHTGIETDIAITYAPYDLGAISGMCGSGLFAGGGSYSQYIHRSTTDTMTGYTWAFGPIGSFSISIPYGTRTVFGHNFLEDGVVRVDGVQKATLPSNPTLLQYPIALMKLNVANNKSDMRFYVKGRLYHVRISDGSIISHNFVPVRFTNELGQPEGAMYDRVSRKLFRNAGTGAFTIGPDVATPVMGLHFMKSPKKTARNYVQDGLIAMWDGIENAGWGVHDAAASIWADLSGNANDLTLWPGGKETWEPQALANASYTNETSCFATMDHDPGQFATIEVVFRNDNVAQTRDVIRPFEVSDSEWHGFLVYPSKLSVGYGSSGAMDYAPVARAIVSASATFASAASQTINDARINGSGVSLTSNWSRTKYDRFVVGGRIATGAPFVGAIYCIRLYSRSLTAAELASNYAVDKERFNLP